MSKPKARRSWAGGQGVDAQAGLGDDPERSLAAHEQLGEVRSGGGPRPLALGVDDAAVGEDDLEPEHHVLDLPVACRVLPRTAAGQPPAHRREVHRLRPVSERVARTGRTERGLEVRSERAGGDVRGERGLVDCSEAGQPGQIEGDATVHGDRPAAHATASGCGRDRHAGLVAGGEGRRNLGGRCRARTTAAGRWGTAPSAAQPIASGHQSRPASARVVVVGDDGGSAGRDALKDGRARRPRCRRGGRGPGRPRRRSG